MDNQLKSSNSFLPSETINSHKLLLDTKLYLKACKNKKISLKTLGLRKLDTYHPYSESTKRRDTSSKTLKAVIPEYDQVEFVRRAGLQENTSVDAANKTTTNVTMDSSRMESIRRSYLLPTGIDNPKFIEMINAHKKKTVKVAPRLDDDGKPIYTHISNRMNEYWKREKDEAIARNESKDRMKKLGSSSYEIVKGDGVKYVYNQNGLLCTEDQYQLLKSERQQTKQVEQPKADGPVYQGALLCYHQFYHHHHHVHHYYHHHVHHYHYFHLHLHHPQSSYVNGLCTVYNICQHMNILLSPYIVKSICNRISFFLFDLFHLPSS